MKTILVVGGAGYIGSHVVLEFLKAGYGVTVLDNLSSGQRINLFEEARFVYGDIQDRLLLRDLLAENFDAVVHLAALKAAGESMESPEKYSYQNINGTLNLLEAVSFSSTRTVIFSSTAAVYGMPRYLPLDEDHPVNPINYYGFTKQEVERFLDWYDRLKNVKYSSLRYFNAAGYDTEGKIEGLEKDPANLIPVVMEVAVGMRESMEVFGNDYATADGTCLRDYIHVSDLASAHVKACETIEQSGSSITLNLGTGKAYSVMEVIRTVEKISGKRIPYKNAPRRSGDPAELYAKADAARKTIGWIPKFSDLETIVDSNWKVYRNRL
ncbi:MAG: UDP-glucose 4-epimerase GalE [Proteobacteria bacterium]|nr:UDP-glucose 4-epimerase GalE [Pseudomonadota bacterium]